MQAGTATDARTIRQILVPVDGSEHAKSAAQTAIRLGSSYKAKLIIVSIVVPPGFFISGPVGAPADLTDYFQLEMEEANGAVNAIAKLAKEADVEAKSMVLRPPGSVAEAIVDFASSEKVDLIVVGTRGLGGFKKLLLGSVSSGVIANAPCSVLVVR
jgi:nucleotide-binding universal stress UspA family protein